MKAKLLRPLEGRDPSTVTGVEFPTPPELIERNGKPRWIWPPGTVIDHWQAYRLVQQGVAMPEDDDCRRAANRTPVEMEAAQHAYERLSRGIHPEDYDKYDRGEILGYNADGSYVPGPNSETLDDDDGDESE